MFPFQSRPIGVSLWRHEIKYYPSNFSLRPKRLDSTIDQNHNFSLVYNCSSFLLAQICNERWRERERDSNRNNRDSTRVSIRARDLMANNEEKVGARFIREETRAHIRSPSFQPRILTSNIPSYHIFRRGRCGESRRGVWKTGTRKSYQFIPIFAPANGSVGSCTVLSRCCARFNGEKDNRWGIQSRSLNEG